MPFLLRPANKQPANSVARSVHPTGMAVDLRIPAKGKCRSWLENTLLMLEGEQVLDVTRERFPPHYHVAVYAKPYQARVLAMQAKDPQHKKLQELYNNKNTLASYRDGANKYTYNEFLAYNPYLYWKSPFGDWIEMLNRRFETAAEKCKPVIYLYPEETGKFSVTVEPNGGFTKTIPEYNNGWFVESTPDSKITDLSSGLEYPYLYWEGVNTGIPEIEKGWIVPIGHIEPFLVDALTRLGLNENEIADFNEYWIARLEKEGHKEYKIMFLEQEKFEELAPLSVDGDEKPASTIRVMMYAQGALPNESLSLQILPPTPARVGFTVVEWGGALLNQ